MFWRVVGAAALLCALATAQVEYRGESSYGLGALRVKTAPRMGTWLTVALDRVDVGTFDAFMIWSPHGFLPWRLCPTRGPLFWVLPVVTTPGDRHAYWIPDDLAIVGQAVAVQYVAILWGPRVTRCDQLLASNAARITVMR